MIDKLIAKYGYKKVHEDKFGVVYKKHENCGDFTHLVHIQQKSSGEHIMHSYDEAERKIDEMYINEACGVEISILLLMWLKAKRMKIKYGWGSANECRK